MPYIEPERRERSALNPEEGGELCYAITLLCKRYMKDVGGERYRTYGDIRHALATTWDEYFLPRFQAYEAKKREENGDV